MNLNKTRIYTSWTLLALLAIPIIGLLLISATACVIVLVLTFIPVSIAPKQEMRFSIKKSLSLRKTWKWGFEKNSK